MGGIGRLKPGHWASRRGAPERDIARTTRAPSCMRRRRMRAGRTPELPGIRTRACRRPGDGQPTGGECEEAGDRDRSPEQGTIDWRRGLSLQPPEGGIAEQPQDGARYEGEGPAHVWRRGN